jgi:hypothetical protein
MAAGLGFKTFTTGEVLTAADTNGYLMQGVLVFASSAARAAAITSPQEGQYSYLKDTNSTEYYDGAAWIAAPIGDITGVTAGTGISGGGTSGTVTVTNSMATEITAAGDIIVGTGSGTFDNLPIGTTAQVLTADTTVSPYKVKWATPGSAAFSGCRLSIANTFAVSNATLTTIGWTAETFDTDTYHDNSTNNSRITIPTGKSGYYLVTSHIFWAWNTTGYRELHLTKNGTDIWSSVWGTTGSSYVSSGANSAIQLVVNLTAADYIELKVKQDTGGNLSINGNDVGQTTPSIFGVNYLGA